MTADASITVFKIKGQFDPKQYHQVVAFEGRIGNVDNQENGKYNKSFNYIRIPRVILNSASTSMTTGASYVTAEFSYTGFGNGEGSIFDMSESSEPEEDSSSSEAGE
jgi:hypothetical protein